MARATKMIAVELQSMVLSFVADLIVNGAFSAKNSKLVESFVRIGQKAFETCVANFHVSTHLSALRLALDKAVQTNQWKRIKGMMAGSFTKTKALGWIDPGRVKEDYDLVSTYIEIDTPFDVSTAFTTQFLDQSITMDKTKDRN